MIIKSKDVKVIADLLEENVYIAGDAIYQLTGELITPIYELIVDTCNEENKENTSSNVTELYVSKELETISVLTANSIEHVTDLYSSLREFYLKIKKQQCIEQSEINEFVKLINSEPGVFFTRLNTEVCRPIGINYANGEMIYEHDKVFYKGFVYEILIDNIWGAFMATFDDNGNLNGLSIYDIDIDDVVKCA